MNHGKVIEMAPFELADGVGEDALFAASDRLEREFLAQCPGYLGRMLVRRDERGWTDIVFWRSAADAKSAMERVASSDACGLYFRCMAVADHDDPAHGVTLLEVVRRYGPDAAASA